jgi:hypothetical protein
VLLVEICCVSLLRILVIELCEIEFHILSIIWFFRNIKNLFDILGFLFFVFVFVCVCVCVCVCFFFFFVYDVCCWILFVSLENCDKGKEKVHRTLDILSLMRFLRKLRISLNYLALVASLIFFMKLCFGLSYV